MQFQGNPGLLGTEPSFFSYLKQAVVIGDGHCRVFEVKLINQFAVYLGQIGVFQEKRSLFLTKLGHHIDFLFKMLRWQGTEGMAVRRLNRVSQNARNREGLRFVHTLPYTQSF